MNAKSTAAKTIVPKLCAALALSALVCLGGLHGAEAGVDVWTTNGPPGGFVFALPIDPRTPTTVYAGTSAASVFKSTDGGCTWSAADSGLRRSDYSIRVLAIDPQTPTTLYAGVSGHPLESVLGVYKSTDGGGSWIAVNTGLTNTNVYALAIDPATPTTVYAGGNVRGEAGRIFKSTDGGGSWIAIYTGLTNIYVSALAIDPQTPTTLYAGTGGGGVSKSTDGGNTWSAVNAGLTNPYVAALAIDPRTPTNLYAGSFAPGPPRGYPGGVFKSTDGGGSWTAINTGLTAASVSALAIDPGTPATLYAGTFGDGVFKSTDGGGIWSALNTGLSNLYIGSLTIHPATPTTLYAGTNAGVFALEQTAESSTVDFDNPPPPGQINGVFEGLDFGTGQWQLSGPYNVNPTNHIYFADSTGTSRNFQFSPGPRVLNGMRVYSTTSGTLTLSDDAGQTFTQAVTTGSLQAVTTGWSRPSTTVTVSFTNGWDLGVDDITYSSAP